ncbi:hypothetical protein [Pseudomonas cremoricolorata]|uniref:Uncharacterized protein n=1 Tax=Pseudomonas cremoricolorata TaxID=157783 RepID=A0A089WI53_9PSED|nr:hypothetical protein [Pseudomonas cremoricolorata]AIR88271.1 hypothetical protein LK03_03020 [Pseudomonas cremoricolorata]
MQSKSVKKHLSDEIKATEAHVKSAKLEKTRALHTRKLDLLNSLQRYVERTASKEDALLADVVNDLLQSCGLLDKNKTFRDLGPADAAP